MKKKLCLMVGLMLTVLLALSFTACDLFPVQKILVVTGITGYTGEALVAIFTNPNNPKGSLEAAGDAIISGGTVSFELVDDNDHAWTGEGEYYVMLILGPNNTNYYYSGGLLSARKLKFSSETTTVSYDQFRLNQ